MSCVDVKVRCFLDCKGAVSCVDVKVRCFVDCKGAVSCVDVKVRCSLRIVKVRCPVWM